MFTSLALAQSFNRECVANTEAALLTFHPNFAQKRLFFVILARKPTNYKQIIRAKSKSLLSFMIHIPRVWSGDAFHSVERKKIKRTDICVEEKKTPFFSE